jgi:pimeloyl-ACP methyl ester carboxylesterase
LRELVERGFRVHAPALPGFGGTASLPARRRTMAGYAEWVDEFFTAAEIHDPAIVIGHSFGGGVAIRLAHDFPGRVRRLVLINSVGHRTRSDGSGVAGASALRPLWVVGLHFAREMFASRHSHRIVKAIAEDATMNVVANPWSFVSVGRLVRRADLVAELGELQRRGLAILVLWGSGDGTLPRSSFDALSAASGTEGMLLKGGHLWLIAQPSKLGDIVADFLQVDDANRGHAATAGRRERANGSADEDPRPRS